MMVMTRSGGFGRRRLLKGSSNNKEKVFNQERLAIDPIDVKPLNSTPLTLLVPYRMFENEVLIANALGSKENSPIESQNTASPNLGNNPVQTLPDTLVLDTKIEADPFEDSPVEKDDS